MSWWYIYFYIMFCSCTGIGNGVNYNLITDSVSGGNIRECQSNQCDLSPCMNDGVCSSSGRTFQYQC